MPKPTKAELEVRINGLRSQIEQRKAATQVHPEGVVTNAQLDPFTVLLEDLLDFLIELLAAFF